MGQQLRLCTSIAGAWVPFLVGELRSGPKGKKKVGCPGKGKPSFRELSQRAKVT